MKRFDLPSGTRVTLVSLQRVSRGKVLRDDTVFFEDDVIGSDHWGFRFVGEGEIGFVLPDGWGDASQGVLVVEMEMDGGNDE